MNLTNIDICGLFTPGRYEIICLITNRTYIGESTNVLSRLGYSIHSDDLEKQRHDCSDLQSDFNRYGKHAFKFKAIMLGSAYANSKKRKTIEQNLIANNHNCYNRLNISTWQRPYQQVQINDQTYQSLRSAARILKQSRTNLTRKCRDISNPNYNFITTDTKQETVYSKKSKPCIINGIMYESMATAAKHVKQSASTIRRRCMSKTNLNYRFVEESRSND